MADVDQSVLIEAFVRYGALNGRPALVAIFNTALQNTLAGVQITSVTFEGASGSGVAQSVDSAKLLVIVEQALQIMDGDLDSRRVTYPDFGGGFILT